MKNLFDRRGFIAGATALSTVFFAKGEASDQRSLAFPSYSAPEAFNRVFVDDGGNLAWDIDSTVDSSVVWNNRIDFCRDACYLNSTSV